MYLPALEAVDGTELGVALLNSGSTDAQVTITARTDDGNIISGAGVVNPYTMAVPAAGKVDVRLSGLFGSGISQQQGWLEIDPSTPDVKAYSFVYDAPLNFVEGVDVSSGGSNEILFPKISQASNATLRIVNAAPAAIEATISLYDNSSTLVAVLPLHLPALSGVTRTAAGLAQNNPGFEGYAVVQTMGSTIFTQPSLVGFETYRNNSDLAAVRGIPSSRQMRNGYWSHFASQNGFTSRLTLINTSDLAETMRITAETTAGTNSVTQTLLPHQQIETTVADMFGFSGSSLISGDLRFETQTGTSGVFGVLEYGAADGSSLSAAEPQSQPESDFYFPHVVQGAGYYTGIALQNPNVDASTVFLDLFDKAGVARASTSFQLNPGERRAGVIDQFFQSAIEQMGGYVRVSADQPIYAQQLMGSSDSTAFLANVPAQESAGAPSFTAFSKNSAPSVSSLSPSSALIDNLTSLNVRISGSGFTRDSVVHFDGVAISTTYLKSGILAITLLAPQLTAAVHTIQVSNPTAVSNVAKLLLASGTYPTNQAPTVSAGAGQTITLPSTASLSGTASDDGLPVTTSLTTTWSKVSGAGTVSFGNAGSLSTTASFSASGAYTLRLTAFDGSLSNTSDITINVNPAPAPAPAPDPTPTPSPAPTPIMTVSSPLTLSTTAVIQGQTMTATITYTNTGSAAMSINKVAITSRAPGGTNAGGPAYDFSPVSGPATIQPGATLTVSASRAFTTSDPTGTWYAYATYQDTALVWHDGTNINFTVSAPAPAPAPSPSPAPTNQAPVVNAGANQTITLPSSANLSGTASDDGLPSGTLTTTWSMSSGPGTVTFGNANALSTTASFSTSGTYVLKLTASDTALTSSSTVNVVVNPAVVSPTVSVAISPTSASIQTGATQQFTATVTGATNTAVTWSATAGSITTSGVYTAPATAGTYTVTATSQQDATKMASATVTVSAPAAAAFFSTLPPGSALPSETYCAGNVTSSTWEPRPDNNTANHTTGSNVGIRGMPTSINSRISGNFTGTTNQILQWSACKWGIDEDLVRAQAVEESNWHQNAQGDYTTDATLCSNLGKTAPCYQSYGILQIKGSSGNGTYPLSQTSTAFNADWSRGFLRSCYEGYFTWLGGTYAAGDLWGCVGAYFSGSWYDSGAVNYINNVKSHYATKPWLKSGF